MFSANASRLVVETLDAREMPALVMPTPCVPMCAAPAPCMAPPACVAQPCAPALAVNLNLDLCAPINTGSCHSMSPGLGVAANANVAGDVNVLGVNVAANVHANADVGIGLGGIFIGL